MYIYNKKKSMSGVKKLLDDYLRKDTRITEKQIDSEHKQVCDLDTGDCYTIRMKDGLIERFDNSIRTNRTLKVETPTGTKTLLNG
jgi:hypothetical protein